MRTMQIPSSIAFLICASSAVAQEIDIRGVDPNEVIDEVVVVGAIRCGSWPIKHQRVRGCEFAELKKENRPKLLRMRREFFSDCLNCLGSRCTMKAWPEDRTTEKLLCKRLFRTPTRVSRFIKPHARFSPLRVSYSYDISAKGKVGDIELISFDGDIEEEELLQLIRDGAARTRFEPIVVADVAYELAGLRDAFILDDFGSP